MKYRPEIDGLRALAVIPVILFHSGLQLFSGGFVGVDIFFVISGYLMTMILIEGLESDRLSLMHFYERRARRILPALFFVMFLCIPFAWMWMLPSQLKDFSESLVAVSFFSSNFLFLSESGYFSDAAEAKPLLHTWSLAVEEQYYLLLPIFMLCTWRFAKHRVFWLFVFLTALSFAYAEWGFRNKTIAFYLSPSRAWELFMGSLAAFIVHKRGVQENNALSSLGLFAVVCAIFVYDESTPFPGVYTLLPVVGTVLLVLFAGKKTYAATLLSNKFLVAIGLISYSAYLWHQPLFAFVRVAFAEKDSQALMSVLSFLSFVLAYFSWKYIEKPFRDKNIVTTKRFWVLSFSVLTVFIALGVLGHKADGFKSRVSVADGEPFPELTSAVLQEWNFALYPPHPMMDEYSKQLNRFGSGDDKVLFLGDSHSSQYWNAFGYLFQKQQERTENKSLFVGKFSFPPKLNNIEIPDGVHTVVLSYFWSLKYKSETVNNFIRCCGKGPNGVLGLTYTPSTEDEMDVLDSYLQEFVVELKRKNIKVVIILDNPFGEELNAQSLVHVVRGTGIKVRSNELLYTDLTRSRMLARSEPVRSRLTSIADEYGLQVIDPIEFLCGPEICPKFSKEGYLLYKDYDHISLNALNGDVDYIFKILD